MTIELGRRSFLFGLGAVVTAAAIKIPDAIAIPTPPTLVVPPGLRVYRDMTFDVGDISEAEIRQPIIWDVYVTGFDGIQAVSRTMQHFVTSPYAIMRWCAHPGGEIIVMPDECLQISVSGRPNIANANLFFHQDGVDYLERHMPVGSGGTLMRLRA